MKGLHALMVDHNLITYITVCQEMLLNMLIYDIDDWNATHVFTSTDTQDAYLTLQIHNIKVFNSFN